MITISGPLFLLNIYDRISVADGTQAAAMIGFVIGSSIPPLLFWLILKTLVLKWFDRKETGHQIRGFGAYILSGAAAAALTSGGINLLLGAIENAPALAFAYAIAGALGGGIALLTRRRHIHKQQAEVADVFAP